MEDPRDKMLREKKDAPKPPAGGGGGGGGGGAGGGKVGGGAKGSGSDPGAAMRDAIEARRATQEARAASIELS